MSERYADNPLTLRVGNEQIIIRRCYEMLSILNGFLIASWFLLGSILLLYPEHEKMAVRMFIIGSFQFLLRAIIHLLAHIHIQRVLPSNRQG